MLNSTLGAGPEAQLLFSTTASGLSRANPRALALLCLNAVGAML